MLRFIANRKLRNALKSIGAPMQMINTHSWYFQDIIEEIKMHKLSPEEGAKHVLNAIYHAFDRQHALRPRRLQ